MARILKIEEIKDELSKLLSERFPKDWPKEWIEYAEEYNIDRYNIWEMFLWSKNEKNEIIVNISKENIKRCQQLYDKNPEDDKDNLFRLLLLKIFSGQECRDLTTKFLKLFEMGDFNFYIVVGLVLNKYDAIEPYLPRLKNFFLWLMDISPERFRKAIMDDFEDESPYVFQAIFNLVGSHMACQIMDTNELYFMDIYEDVGYVECYVTAKACFLEKKWFEAFILFRKLETFNERYKLTDEVLYNDFKDSFQYFNDILHSPPTIEEIKNRSYECYLNLINSGDKIKLYELIGTIDKDLRTCQQQTRELLRKFSEPYVQGNIMINNLTLKLQEFVSKILSKYYGNDRDAWLKGTILTIGRNKNFHLEQTP